MNQGEAWQLQSAEARLSGNHFSQMDSDPEVEDDEPLVENESPAYGGPIVPLIKPAGRSSPRPDRLRVEYRCTRTHLPRPPPRLPGLPTRST